MFNKSAAKAAVLNVMPGEIPQILVVRRPMTPAKAHEGINGSWRFMLRNDGRDASNRGNRGEQELGKTEMSRHYGRYIQTPYLCQIRLRSSPDFLKGLCTVVLASKAFRYDRHHRREGGAGVNYVKE